MDAKTPSAPGDRHEIAGGPTQPHARFLPVLVSLGTHRRRPRFREPNLARAVFGMLTARSDTLAVCLLPDRLHWLLEDGVDLPRRVGRFKGFTTFLCHRAGFDGRLWQRSFRDQPVRRGQELRRVADYIVQDPVRRGLVREAEHYPYRAVRIGAVRSGAAAIGPSAGNP